MRKNTENEFIITDFNNKNLEDLPRIFEMIDEDILFTTKDISELLAVHPETVRRWCRTGKLRNNSPGGRYIVQGSDLKLFLYQWYKIR